MCEYSSCSLCVKSSSPAKPGYLLTDGHWVLLLPHYVKVPLISRDQYLLLWVNGKRVNGNGRSRLEHDRTTSHIPKENGIHSDID